MLTVQHGQLCEPQRRVEQAHCVEQHHKEHQSDHGPRNGVALGRAMDAHTAQVHDQSDAPVEADLAHNVLPVDYTGLPLVFRAHEGQQSQTHAEERHCHEEGRVVHEHDQGCVDHSAHQVRDGLHEGHRVRMVLLQAKEKRLEVLVWHYLRLKSNLKSSLVS